MHPSNMLLALGEFKAEESMHLITHFTLPPRKEWVRCHRNEHRANIKTQVAQVGSSAKLQ